MNRMGMGEGNFPLAHSYHEDIEIEVLQADVMRFMAILGFILTIIFALVQSLPFAPEKSRLTAEQKELLSKDIANLKQHVLYQLEVLQDLRQDIESAKKLKKEGLAQAHNATERKERLLQDTTFVKSALDQSHHRLQEAESHMENQSRSLQLIRVQIEKERNHLQVLQSRVSQLLQRVKPANELRKNILTEPRISRQQAAKSEHLTSRRTRELRLERIQNELIRLQTQREPQADQVKVKKDAPTNQTPLTESNRTEESRVDGRKGFTLKFESDAAFHRVLKGHVVKFLVMVNGKAWQVQLRAGIPRFVSSPLSSRYYQMDSLTVPNKYVLGFKPIAAAHKKDSVIWGVVLPDQIIDAINSMISGKIGGDVVISGDGEIRMENQNP